MTFTDKKIQITIDHIRTGIDAEVYEAEEIYYIPCEYKTSNTPPASDAGWKKLEENNQGYEINKHYWIKFDIDVPKQKENIEYRLRVTTGREGLWYITNPQCIVYTCEEVDIGELTIKIPREICCKISLLGIFFAKCRLNLSQAIDF